ncbi:hypothetical protein SAMN05192555_101147 [Franzmannia pantelleriensis]|uniref:Uncharacterized protein n=1 Tax=Franzmannia pantelleriensis TaxID=48727 RepID=A0A1G9EKW1_9GAMM|nr:hypothetical protein [Halomonas pantelleriensis]SDK76739.1 hypothetical protein SAMN05192555_101147 [Halomonas pantelleriensis]
MTTAQSQYSQALALSPWAHSICGFAAKPTLLVTAAALLVALQGLAPLAANGDPRNHLDVMQEVTVTSGTQLEAFDEGLRIAPISDGQLEQIRGRFAVSSDIRSVESDGVILWDERPGAKGTTGPNGQQRSVGQQNQQRQTMTTSRSK